MAQVDFLRRYADSIVPKGLTPLYPSVGDPVELDPATAISMLAAGGYVYLSTITLNSTYKADPLLIPLGDGYFNDLLWVTDSLLIGQPNNTFTLLGIGEPLTVWVLADSNGRTLYIPTRDDYYSIVRPYLPHIKVWDRSKHQSTYPSAQYWLEGDLDRWPEVYELVLEGNGHPFANGLAMTGFVTIQGDGVPVYEYADLTGCLGTVGKRYLTSLRSPSLDFPLGQPKDGDLVKDLCVGELGWYPSFGYWPWVGKYTGFKTAASYHPLRAYYLYERGDGSVFLTEAPPHKDGWAWVESAFGGGLVLELEPIYAECAFEGLSCGLSFTLEDASLIPPGYQYPYSQEDVGDCVTFNDSYLLRGGRRAWRYVDDLFPVTDNYTFSDMR